MFNSIYYCYVHTSRIWPCPVKDNLHPLHVNGVSTNPSTCNGKFPAFFFCTAKETKSAVEISSMLLIFTDSKQKSWGLVPLNDSGANPRSVTHSQHIRHRNPRVSLEFIVQKYMSDLKATCEQGLILNVFCKPWRSSFIQSTGETEPRQPVTPVSPKLSSA